MTRLSPARSQPSIFRRLDAKGGLFFGANMGVTHRALLLAVTVAVTVAVSACASQASVDEVRVSLGKMRRELVACTLGQQKQGEQLAALQARLDAADALQQARADAPQQQPSAPAKPTRPSTGRPAPAEIYAITVGDSPARGAADAWVTLVEISDFECPYCARVKPTLAGLLDKYGDDLRVVFKHHPLPFHKRAMAAAIASECAHAQGRFWPLHDLLFKNPRRLGDEKIFAYVRQAGRIDFAQWKSCYDGAAPASRISADTAQAQALGARGTPSFFINGRFLSGAQPASAFEAVIDGELGRARQSGIPRADYYQRAVVDRGRSAP